MNFVIAGSWNAGAGLQLCTSVESYPIWSASVLLSKGTVVEYK